jgi:ABC-2 type transport system permease protein
MNALRRTAAIARKELRQLRRDRLSLGMIVGVPLLQILLFGYAINTDVRHLRAAVADFAGGERARRLIADSEASQAIDVVGRVPTVESLTALLRRGVIHAGVVIPHDIERRAASGDRPLAQLLVDGSDPLILGAAEGLAGLPVETRAPAAPPRLSAFEVRPYYNPERRSAVQIVPGLTGVILTMTLVVFTAIAMVRERERGTLEFLITTPVRRAELLVGKIVPYVGIGLLQMTVVLTIGVTVFRVPVRGALADAYLAALPFIAANLTLGLIVSTLAQTQFQAIQMAVFVFLPSILLSGFMFPFHGMPRLAQAIGELLPLTHFVRLMRGVLLRGAALEELWADVWPLLVFFVVAFVLAVLRFRKRLD